MLTYFLGALNEADLAFGTPLFALALVTLLLSWSTIILVALKTKQHHAFVVVQLAVFLFGCLVSLLANIAIG